MFRLIFSRIAKPHFLLIFLLFGNPAYCIENGLALRMAASDTRINQGNLFGLNNTGGYGLQEAAYRYTNNGFSTQLTGYNEIVSGDPTGKADVNELYWDKSFEDWELTVGKKRLGWGVGFGFRPLDVIVREPRRDLIPAATVGLPMIAVEHITSDIALTLLCGDDFGDDDRADLVTINKSSSAECAARYYGLIDDWDTQVVLHSTPSSDAEAGFALARVVGESLEIHTEWLIQHHYHKFFNKLLDGNSILVTSDPIELREYNNGLQALIGMTYTWESGHSIISEFWHDDSAYSHSEWKKINALVSEQKNLYANNTIPVDAIQQNILASARYLTQRNLAKDNFLLRWAFDGETYDPEADVLYLPNDGAKILTISLDTKLADSMHLIYGARRFFGNEQSIAHALPDIIQGFITLNANFSW